MEDGRLCSEQTCHSAAKGITRLIGLTHSIEARKPTEETGDGVYRLDIATTGVTIFERMNWNFDHSLVILKCGADLVLFQCFSREYTLEEWLTASGRLLASDCARKYSPSSPKAKLGSIDKWLGKLDATIGSFNQRNWKAFAAQATELFGSGEMRGSSSGQEPPPNIALEVRWRRYKLGAV